MPDPLTRERIVDALRGVFDPELGSDVVDLGMVREITIDGGVVTVGLALTIAECPMRSQIENDTVRKITAIPGVDDVIVETRAMTKAQRAGLMDVARRRARENATPTQVSATTRAIAVGSGKGGVGKSSVSVNLALALSRLGYRVGLLDADIWGFSIPRMLGTVARYRGRLGDEAHAAGGRSRDPGGIHWAYCRLRGDRPHVAWADAVQGPRPVPPAGGEWGELDYLVIDMPPGTGDIQMALSRLLPQAEMLVVTTPAKNAQKVAIRVADMARRSAMPVVGGDREHVLLRNSGRPSLRAVRPGWRGGSWPTPWVSRCLAASRWIRPSAREPIPESRSSWPIRDCAPHAPSWRWPSGWWNWFLPPSPRPAPEGLPASLRVSKWMSWEPAPSVHSPGSLVTLPLTI